MIRFYFYRRLTLRGRRWYWRLLAGNSKVIADGGEGYVNFGDARDATQIIRNYARDADEQIEDDKF